MTAGGARAAHLAIAMTGSQNGNGGWNEPASVPKGVNDGCYPSQAPAADRGAPWRPRQGGHHSAAIGLGPVPCSQGVGLAPEGRRPEGLRRLPNHGAGA